MLEKEKGGGTKQLPESQSVLMTPLWRMLYADDAEVVS